MTFNFPLYRALRELGIDNDSSVTLANGVPLSAPAVHPDTSSNSMEPTLIHVRQGVPYRRVITIVGGASTWASTSLFEVKMQIREQANNTAPLIADLSNKLTKAIVDGNIDITLSLTGADTVTLRTGKYDMVISDTGPTDAKAQVLLFGDFNVTETISL